MELHNQLLLLGFVYHNLATNLFLP